MLRAHPALRLQVSSLPDFMLLYRLPVGSRLADLLFLPTSSPLFTMGFVQCLNYACTNSAMMEAIQWGIIQCTSRYCDDDDVDCH